MADTTASFTAQQAVDTHHNHLWDVVALLEAAVQRIEEDTPSLAEDPAANSRMHNTGRLIYMAKERVHAAADAFSEIDPATEVRHG